MNASRRKPYRVHTEVMPTYWLIGVLLAVSGTGCTLDVSKLRSSDGGNRDASADTVAEDALSVDASRDSQGESSLADAVVHDGFTMDAARDTSMPDASVFDTAAPDTSPSDGAIHDSSTVDTSRPDARVDASTSCRTFADYSCSVGMGMCYCTCGGGPVLDCDGTTCYCGTTRCASSVTTCSDVVTDCCP